jgi:hypothetical protein
VPYRALFILKCGPVSGAHSDFCQHAAFNWLRKLIYQFVGPRATTQVNGKLEKILFAASSSRRHWRVISTDARWQMPSWREPPGPWDPRIRSGRKSTTFFYAPAGPGVRGEPRLGIGLS